MKLISLALQAGVLAGLLTGLWALSKPSDLQGTPTPPPPPRVTTAPVTHLRLTPEVPVTATLRARATSQLAFQVPGRVLDRRVTLGQRVSKGDILMRLDARASQHNLEAARATLARLRAELAQATRDASRADALLKTNVATAQQAERARAGQEQLAQAARAAQVSVDEASRLRREATLRAPFDGTITAIHTETGAFASPGQPVLTLSSAEGLEARFELPERHVGAITKDQTLTLTFPQRPGAAPVPATVVTAGQAALGAGRLFPIVAHLPARPDVLPGMTVAAALPMPARDVFTVPASAIVAPAGGDAQLLVVRDGLATRVSVTLRGTAPDGALQVEGDLKNGERVVTSGHVTLSEGAEVQGGTP